jgi:hypothetical protein
MALAPRHYICANREELGSLVDAERSADVPDDA